VCVCVCVCVSKQYRADVHEHQWRDGTALRPYFDDVQRIVESKHKIPDLRPHLSAVVDKRELSFVHCPIVDCDVTDDATVLKLCRRLVDDVSKGDVIYLHCWGGHGRTGTVVSIMLHMMYGVRIIEIDLTSKPAQ
jgi:protein tyrosine phosphatase